MKSYLIKYAGEISTKQSRTRWRMINKLYSNIVKALKYHNIKLTNGKANWDFIFVEVEEKALEILRNIGGIQYLAEVDVFQKFEKKEILEIGHDLFKDKLKGKKFAVRCRNRLKNRRNYRSMEVEAELGSKLYDYADGVNLSKPDITCHVEIREEGTFFYSEKILGIIGFPMGNTGRGIVMLSGGIDSPVAAYSAIRMGITPVFVYYDLGGKSQRKITIETYKFLYEKYLPGQNIHFVEISFLDVVDYIRTLPHKYQNLLLKYFFYKVSEKLGDWFNVHAVITGEALGQVSTQTIENIILLDNYIKYSVFRPTLFMPKLDIIDIAEKIGTLDMSYKGKEFCAIANKNVATAGRKDIFDNIIKDIPLEEMLKEIMENKREYTIETIDTIYDNSEVVAEDASDYQLINLGSKVISPSEMKMSLEDALNDFANWDSSILYKISCDEGIKSQILANEMKAEGFNVV